MFEKFKLLFEIYKSRYGQTFSYYDTSCDEARMQTAIALMQQALDGDRGIVTNADLGIDHPLGSVT